MKWICQSVSRKKVSKVDEKMEKLENTLQSIEGTLKRIEENLIDQTRPKNISINISKRDTYDLVKEHT